MAEMQVDHETSEGPGRIDHFLSQLRSVYELGGIDCCLAVNEELSVLLGGAFANLHRAQFTVINTVATRDLDDVFIQEQLGGGGFLQIKATLEICGRKILLFCSYLNPREVSVLSVLVPFLQGRGGSVLAVVCVEPGSHEALVSGLPIHVLSPLITSNYGESSPQVEESLNAEQAGVIAADYSVAVADSNGPSEDRYCVSSQSSCRVFAVYDGHGGIRHK
jgi:hypothetical protein